MSEAVVTAYEAVIGLEVHVQMNTRSKAYSSDGYDYGASPNSQVSPITLGHPGTLPKANAGVVRNAVRLGLACGCTIREFNAYARKNYFYPDLPKGYQITQDETPICTGGGILISSETLAPKTIGLTRIHMEEDTGKSIHDLDPFHTLLDLNRAGVPLLEIVSEPDFRSGEEAYLYLQEIRKLVRYLDISDGNMEEGSLRCDVNISIRPVGREKFGTKVEVKNLNSFRNVQRAIDYEYERQCNVLKARGTLSQETRTFDATKGHTIAMRSKEDANDYRYFIEPDLAPVRVSDDFKASIASSMPPLPQALVKRYQEELGLSRYDAQLLTEYKETALYYEALLAAGCPAKAGVNWLMGPVQGWLNERALDWSQWTFPAASLTGLIALVESNTVSFSAAAQQLFPLLLASPGADPKVLAEENGLLQESDESALLTHVDAALAAFPDKVEEYKAGKKGLIGLFMGEVMKRSRGAADPKVTSKLIEQRLRS
ncbi:MAG: Asp-tRNA(Asn)/Glu-tRNA(Gln) amidotransferase subunit GatB [Schleiferiaceae bacterium]|nr:Asp-tRNA(Asn)/Glu-tRNA(Gln) amidotransferase subunit GatB [Schleiferiaceae bacterium]